MKRFINYFGIGLESPFELGKVINVNIHVGMKKMAQKYIFFNNIDRQRY